MMLTHHGGIVEASQRSPHPPGEILRTQPEGKVIAPEKVIALGILFSNGRRYASYAPSSDQG
ncbi:hypothetical protein [Ktedonobacter robiniae]|uniref:Uncharacterized protein n=1 Tax=Ktedonobacter robiniae TaxID=2778365 RepID=A0ABQ3V6F6_9CHLR|nr:hypothetical protein [Ktedonobacter robiniae]GHO60465.1 hypothetical protein KSB_89400 [Ktedonobacter robiniae]